MNASFRWTATNGKEKRREACCSSSSNRRSGNTLMGKNTGDDPEQNEKLLQDARNIRNEIERLKKTMKAAKS
jgi:hypothetical protein